MQQAIINVIQSVIKHFDKLYEFLSQGINYLWIAHQLKSLSFIIGYMSEVIRILGNLYI